MLPSHYTLPTVKVAAPEGGGFIVINASDYDAEVHELWTEPERGASVAAAPPRFRPGFDLKDPELALTPAVVAAFEALGLTSAEAILARAENPEWYDEIHGVGRNTARRIERHAMTFAIEEEE